MVQETVEWGDSASDDSKNKNIFFIGATLSGEKRNYVTCFYTRIIFYCLGKIKDLTAFEQPLAAKDEQGW